MFNFEPKYYDINYTNERMYNSILTCYNKLNEYERIIVGVSGGRDSSVVLDIVTKLIKKMDKKVDVHYVYFDTGIEFKATKDYIKYLENKYNIVIEHVKPLTKRTKKGVPCKRQGEMNTIISARKHGVPFLNKQVSEYIQRLQQHNFNWIDGRYEDLIELYPDCKVALRWWCNKNPKNSPYNIERNRFLREFMILNPPTFYISNICCHNAKKNLKYRKIKEYNIELSITGIRNSEGGVRTFNFSNCFTKNTNKCDEYRPIFFFTSDDLAEYERLNNIINSLAYTKYGLKRTGCAGCPFGLNCKDELIALCKYETNLFKAVYETFYESYNYKKKYIQFREYMKQH